MREKAQHLAVIKNFILALFKRKPGFFLKLFMMVVPLIVTSPVRGGDLVMESKTA